MNSYSNAADSVMSNPIKSKPGRPVIACDLLCSLKQCEPGLTQPRDVKNASQTGSSVVTFLGTADSGDSTGLSDLPGCPLDPCPLGPLSPLIG